MTKMRRILDRDGPTLIGIISSKRPKLVCDSNSLSYMAEATSITWRTISGLEVEDGVTISKETGFFAKRAAMIYENKPGNIFFIPHLDDRDYLRNNEAPIIDIMLFLKKEKLDDESSSAKRSLESQYDKDLFMKMWLEMTRQELAIMKGMNDMDLNDGISGEIIEFMREILIQFTQAKKLNAIFVGGENMSLMVDAFGPNFIPTHTTVPPMSDFSCHKCIRIIRVAQFSIVGYKILPLSAAFAVSLYPSKKQVHRPHASFIGLDPSHSSDLERETRRLTKLATMLLTVVK
jgi:hypothetical protein